MFTAIELEPIYTEKLSPLEYVRLYREYKYEIESAEIVPPQLGREGFGHISSG